MLPGEQWTWGQAYGHLYWLVQASESAKGLARQGLDTLKKLTAACSDMRFEVPCGGPPCCEHIISWKQSVFRIHRGSLKLPWWWHAQNRFPSIQGFRNREQKVCMTPSGGSSWRSLSRMSNARRSHPNRQVCCKRWPLCSLRAARRSEGLLARGEHCRSSWSI